MLVLFDWKKIKNYSNSRVNDILLVMFYITYKPVPIHEFDIYYKIAQQNWYGTSFLVHPEELLQSSEEYSNREVAEYIALASLRNYGEYKATQNKTLDLFRANITEKQINNNRLLTLKDSKIYFKWE